MTDQIIKAKSVIYKTLLESGKPLTATQIINKLVNQSIFGDGDTIFHFIMQMIKCNIIGIAEDTDQDDAELVPGLGDNVNLKRELIKWEQRIGDEIEKTLDDVVSKVTKVVADSANLDKQFVDSGALELIIIAGVTAGLQLNHAFEERDVLSQGNMVANQRLAQLLEGETPVSVKEFKRLQKKYLEVIEDEPKD